MENKIDSCLAGIHRIEVTQTKMQSDIARNTIDLEEHIRRTELLEKKLSKVYAASLMIAGFLTAKFGPNIFKILGVF